ncbi:hypothetical protein DFP73DRAFT_524854 [Morchella snyderi]|nr:hypothetical protein DFP73DRAFT_524854 [Morchella snyderi]
MRFAVLQAFILMAISAAAASTPATDPHPPMPIVTSVTSESLAEDERAYQEGRMSEERIREEEEKNERSQKIGTEKGEQVSGATTLSILSFGGLITAGLVRSHQLTYDHYFRIHGSSIRGRELLHPDDIWIIVDHDIVHQCYSRVTKVLVISVEQPAETTQNSNPQISDWI